MIMNKQINPINSASSKTKSSNRVSGPPPGGGVEDPMY